MPCPSGMPVEKNRPLTVDMGLILDGYCSDMTRTFVPGRADDRYLELHRLVRRAQLAGMQAIRAGVRASEVDRAARSDHRRRPATATPSAMPSATASVWPSMKSRAFPRGTAEQLKAGMVVTVEPGIYIPGWGGIRLENMVVVRRRRLRNPQPDTTWLDI